jgi:predicted ATP-grasp superfamily ATP-dependent carboligase
MKKLKILVFEYITGGGFNKSDLPESLAREGLLMLRSLLDGLAKIASVEVFIMLDSRMVENLPNQLKNSHIIDSEKNCHQEFTRLMVLYDAVWPIAPESGSILQTLCEEAERSGKILLASPAVAVAVAGDKWLTYGRLKEHSIATVPTQRLADFGFTSGEWLIKPFDGVGCVDSYLTTDHEAFATITANLDKGKYLVQPHIPGEKTSLSCLFKQGRGWLLCANRQHFDLINKQYHLVGITVNFTPDISKYQNLLNEVAKAMPELWGYVGIDLIETLGQILVLEINPRLTSSYVGINEALGINCAEAVLDLLVDDPLLQPTRNQPIYITITGKENDAD